MRDYLLQTPQKDSPSGSGSASRRPKLSAERNRKSHKPSQKNLTPELSARAEDALGFGSPKDSIDSSSVGGKSEGNHLDDSSESLDSTGLMTPASSTSSSSVSRVEESPLSVQILLGGSPAQTEDSTVSMTPASSAITFQASDGDYINNYSPSTSITTSDGSNSGTGSNSKVSTVKEEGLSSSSVEVELALKSLRSAQLQVSKAKNVDEESKRILDALVNTAVEGITQLPVERDWIDELMSKKGSLVLLLIVLWTLAIFAFLFNSSRGIISYNGAVPT